MPNSKKKTFPATRLLKIQKRKKMHRIISCGDWKKKSRTELLTEKKKFERRILWSYFHIKKDQNIFPTNKSSRQNQINFLLLFNQPESGCIYQFSIDFKPSNAQNKSKAQFKGRSEKIYFHFLSNWMKYDHSDRFLFDYAALSQLTT